MYALPCLHCGDTENPRTDEHVLQKGFGTSLVLEDEVCGDCNTRKFSPLDTRLVEFVRTRVCWDHPDVKGKTVLQEGLGLHLDPTTSTWLTVRVDRSLNVLVLPQLLFPGDNVVRFVGNNDGRDGIPLIDVIRGELREPAALNVTVDIQADREPGLQPALVRTAKRTYLLRVPNQADGDHFQRLIASGRLLSDWQQTGVVARTTVNPEVNHGVVWRFGDVARAIAKTAVNFARVALGPDLVRNPMFDAVRDFVRASDGSDCSRFVDFLFGNQTPDERDDILQRITHADHHSLLFAAYDGIPMVLVVLYQRPFAGIRLTEVPNPELFSDSCLFLGLFNYRLGTHRLIRMLDEPTEFGRLVRLID